MFTLTGSPHCYSCSWAQVHILAGRPLLSSWLEGPLEKGIGFALSSLAGGHSLKAQQELELVAYRTLAVRCILVVCCTLVVDCIQAVCCNQVVRNKLVSVLEQVEVVLLEKMDRNLKLEAATHKQYLDHLDHSMRIQS